MRTDGRKGRNTDMHTCRQTDIWTYIQACRRTDIQTYIHTEGRADICTGIRKHTDRITAIPTCR